MSHMHYSCPCVSPQPEVRDGSPETGPEGVGSSRTARNLKAFWAGCSPRELCSAHAVYLHKHGHSQAHICAHSNTCTPPACAHTHTPVHIHPPLHTFMHSHSCIYTHLHTCIYACVHVSTHVPLHTRTHAYAFLLPPGSLATRLTLTLRRWMMPLLVPFKSGVL